MSGSHVSRSGPSLEETKMEVLSRGRMDGMFQAQTGTRTSSRGSMRSAPGSHRPTSAGSLEFLSTETPSESTPHETLNLSSCSSEEDDEIAREQPCITQQGTVMDPTSPADSEWDRILMDFEQQRKEMDKKEHGEGKELELGGDGRAADCLWILQAERESSSDSSNSDLGEFMDDAEIEDNEEKKIETVNVKGNQLSENEQKLRKALAKIRRLDKLLAQRVKKEKEVKEQRVEIEKELQLLEDREKEEQHRKQQQYGRLTDRHKLKETKESETGSSSLVEIGSSSLSSSAVSPVFTTQPGEVFGYENVKGESGVKLDGKGRESESCEEKRVDFIKRNIELAADAASTVAMTDEEKRRLDELLVGLSDERDCEEHSDGEDNTGTMQVSMYGEGFRLGETEAKELQAIESQLNALVPGGNWEERSSSVATLLTSVYQPGPPEGDSNTEECNTKFPENDSQEKSLNKDCELHMRLRDIDRQLENIKASREAETTTELHPLDKEQLQALIQQCVDEQQTLGITLSSRTSSQTSCSRPETATEREETLEAITERVNSQIPDELLEFIESISVDINKDDVDEITVEDLDD